MDCELCELLKVGIAFFLLTKILLPLICYFYKLYAKPGVNPAKLGEWALVTGSTDGIGKAYACALAKKGMNIVLVSRSPYKLQNVKAEIESKYQVKTKIIAVDFKQNEDEIVSAVEDGIKGLEIGVLVNNVGMSYEYPEEFLKMDDGSQMVKDLIAINIVSVNALVRLILPQMVARKRGAVINLSSMSAALPTPLLSVYAAAKAYVLKFTEGLQLEYAPKGITVQCVLPGYVVSNMSKIRKPTLIAPTPETFVRSALGRLGKFSETTGFWSHDLMIAGVNLLPGWLGAKLSFDQLKAIRARALRKKEQAKKE